MVVPPKAAYNILRPETAEALYVLHQITGDPIYREWSWKIFQVRCSLLVSVFVVVIVVYYLDLSQETSSAVEARR